MNNNKMTSLEIRAICGLSTIFSLRMLGMFMVLPVFTICGIALYQTNEALIGIAIAIYGLTQAMFQIPFGLLSDNFGRKPLIIIGLLFFVIGNVIAAISHSIIYVIIGRALQGAGAISSVIMALLSDLVRSQNRTKAMAIMGINFSFIFTVAMVISPIITNKLGLNFIFWIIAFFGIIGILITLTVIPSPNITNIVNRSNTIIKSHLKKLFFHANLMRLNISVFCLHMVLMLNFISLPLIFQNVGLPLSTHWKLYLNLILLAFICAIPLIIYSEKKRCTKQILIGCIICFIITEIMFYNAKSHTMILMVGLELFFICFSIIEAILPSFVSKEAPIEYRGTAMGIYSTSQFLGGALGSFIGGLIVHFYSKEYTFLVNILVLLIWLIICFTFEELKCMNNIRKI